jgi:multisubunit Na+/H+ antiporter MnhG subunit
MELVYYTKCNHLNGWLQTGLRRFREAGERGGRMKKTVTGGILMFFGLFMLAGFLLSKKPTNFLADSILLLLFALAPVACGVLLIRSNYATKKKKERETRVRALAEREKEVLNLARQRNGMVTVPDIVAETSMNTDEADELMRELVLKRCADMKLTEQGTVIYEFLELTPGWNQRLAADKKEIN